VIAVCSELDVVERRGEREGDEAIGDDDEGEEDVDAEDDEREESEVMSVAADGEVEHEADDKAPMGMQTEDTAEDEDDEDEDDEDNVDDEDGMVSWSLLVCDAALGARFRVVRLERHEHEAAALK
jgi:hypothetical protein